MAIFFIIYSTYNNNTVSKGKKFSSPSLKFADLLTSHNTASPNWTLLLTGDIIPARSVNFRMVTKNDFLWPLRNIADILKSADLTLINLESPLLKNCELTNEGMNFCGDKRFVAALTDSGVDVVNLANNHSLNRGWEGLAETEKNLWEAGMETTGFVSYQPSAVSDQTRDVILNVVNDPVKIPDQARLADATAKRVGDDSLICNENIYCSKFAIKTVKNIKVGFLGYNAVGQGLNRKLVKAQITQAKEQVDVLVISIHWGKEYTKEPMPDSEDPKEIGKLLIAWGADVIVGNHPHVVQTVEWISLDETQDKGNKPIFYALGNTVFDQMWSEETKKGILVKLHFSGKNIIKDKTEMIPIGIRDYGEAYLPN